MSVICFSRTINYSIFFIKFDKYHHFLLSSKTPSFNEFEHEPLISHIRIPVDETAGFATVFGQYFCHLKKSANKVSQLFYDA